jgi:hypothetical protein
MVSGFWYEVLAALDAATFQIHSWSGSDYSRSGSSLKNSPTPQLIRYHRIAGNANVITEIYSESNPFGHTPADRQFAPSFSKFNRSENSVHKQG